MVALNHIHGPWGGFTNPSLRTRVLKQSSETSYIDLLFERHSEQQSPTDAPKKAETYLTRDIARYRRTFHSTCLELDDVCVFMTHMYA